ncbi:MAG: hypothetical protein HY434_01175 [Candidatus Liptonbacteria bacterium]|nr:hypothetical protein [Candidatus Liptonbacteria bacterium]
MRKNRNKSVFVIAILIVIALGMIGAGNFLTSTGGGSSKSTRDVALSCTLDMYTKFHIHPHVRIIVNGTEQKVPANVGVTFGCMHPLHTHDDTGTIHVESPEKRDFTLGDFFAVLNKPFSREQVLDYKTDASHEIVMTVDGQASQEYENLVFQDGEQIVIEYRGIKQ